MLTLTLQPVQFQKELLGGRPNTRKRKSLLKPTSTLKGSAILRVAGAPSLRSQMLGQAAAEGRDLEISPFLDSPLLIFREAVWDHYNQELEQLLSIRYLLTVVS